MAYFCQVNNRESHYRNVALGLMEDRRKLFLTSSQTKPRGVRDFTKVIVRSWKPSATLGSNFINIVKAAIDADRREHR